MKKATLYILCILLATTLMAGCFKKQDEKKDSESEKKGNEKELPQELTSIEEEINTIIEEMGGLKNETEEASQQDQQSEQASKNSSEKDDGENKEEQGEGDKGGESKNQEQGEKGGEQQNDQKSEKPGEPKVLTEEDWTKLSEKVDELHFMWNEYLAALAKMEGSTELIESFNDTLNSLTTVISTKDRLKALSQANELYAILPEMVLLYKGNDDMSDIKDMRYYVRHIAILAEQNNAEQVKTCMTELLDLFEDFKKSMEEKNSEEESNESEGGNSMNTQQDLMIKLQLSLDEYNTVVQQNNLQLIELKGNVVLMNITDFEKNMEEKKKEEEKEA